MADVETTRAALGCPGRGDVGDDRRMRSGSLHRMLAIAHHRVAFLHFRQPLGHFLAHRRRQVVVLQHILERAQQAILGLFKFGHVTVVGVTEGRAHLAVELLHGTDHGAVLGRLAAGSGHRAAQRGHDAALHAGDADEQCRQLGILHLGCGFLVEGLAITCDLDQVVEAMLDGGLGAHV